MLQTATHYFFTDLHTNVGNIRIKDKSSNILFWHPGQLVGEDSLTAQQPEEVLLGRLFG